MSIIRSHHTTLYGGNGSNIILRPLSDNHLPLLYKWCADPEVLYWTEGGTDDVSISYGADTVHQIYGGETDQVLYFLVEADGVPIGETWLQKMNLPHVKNMYPETLDVRRIDMCIGEKNYWNKGIGTQFIAMMIDYAFCGEQVDVLHCFCEDYNIRSQRMWEKHRFTKILEEPLKPQPQKGRWQYHYRLTRQDFIDRYRVKVPAEQQFVCPLNELQPSQLYISKGKLQLVEEWFDPDVKSCLDPIPVKRLGDSIFMTDGHTRAVAATIAGWDDVPVYWDEDELDMKAYEINLQWCVEEGILSPQNLTQRIVSHIDYELLWRKRCMEGK